MSNTNIIDVLIENIKTNGELLKEAELAIEEAKDNKREILDRFKDYRKDLSVLMKYADDKHRKQIEELGFDLSDSGNGLNQVAQIAFDLILKAKNNTIENGQWYEAYAKIQRDKKVEPVSYTEFNIKCRSLFNTQRLLRKKSSDPKNTREDMISLNGRTTEKDSKKESSSKNK